MLCSDDKHPDELLTGHINLLAARAVAQGHDPLTVLRCASLNPIRHYRLPVGTLQPGEPMDAVLFADLRAFAALQTFVGGERVAEAGRCLRPLPSSEAVNHFAARPLAADALRVSAEGVSAVRVIEALDGELVTRERLMPPRIVAGDIEPDPERDLLQLLVLNRYAPDVPPALALVTGFGLRRGALASTVAHDSHNIIAVGCSREELVRAVNALVASGGGIALCDGEQLQQLPLPIAGLMSPQPAEQVARAYAELDRAAKVLGSTLRAPYMTLSFMALLVIPALKLSDRGLFDSERFAFVDLTL
jgi:adenine deaminase